jgi:hypothetical protein
VLVVAGLVVILGPYAVGGESSVCCPEWCTELVLVIVYPVLECSVLPSLIAVRVQPFSDGTSLSRNGSERWLSWPYVSRLLHGVIPSIETFSPDAESVTCGEL